MNGQMSQERPRLAVQPAPRDAQSSRRRTGTARSTGSTPGIRIGLARGLLPKVHTCVTQALQQRGANVEVGGMWIGELDDRGSALRFKLHGLTEAGPKAVCMPESILFDQGYQARMLTAIRLQHPGFGNMGCFHRHPGTMFHCSSGDHAADRVAVASSDTRALVFTIVTLEPGCFDPRSVYYRNLRLDFYVMAEQTGFEYVQVSPTLLRSPVVEPSPALARLSLVRGPEVFEDLGALQRLRGIERLSIELGARGRPSSVSIQVQPGTSQKSLRVWVREDGGLQAFIEEGSESTEFPGPWGKAEVGRHVWLSHVFLQMLSALGHTAEVNYPLHCAGLLEDKKRLVAEVRAMQEKFGDQAVLRHDKGQLYWEYTVEESGRRFPIEVRYPKHYPVKPPRVYSLLPLPHSPHQLVNNELCWIDQYSLRGDWNPARDTAAICVHAAHRWFACLLVYLTLGKWPEGADDQPAGRPM